MTHLEIATTGRREPKWIHNVYRVSHTLNHLWIIRHVHKSPDVFEHTYIPLDAILYVNEHQIPEVDKPPETKENSG